MNADNISITILPDGTIKTQTSGVSPANHSSAEQFLKLIAQMAGGKTERSRVSSQTVHFHGADGHLHEADDGHTH